MSGLRGELRGELESVLARAGLDAGSVTVFTDAVLLAGAVTTGAPVAEVETGFVPSSMVRDPGWGISRSQDDPGSVDAHCAVADRAQLAVEAVNQVLSRLERVRLAAVAEEVTAMGRAELARRDLSDPDELSATGRERWRARSKSRVRQDLGPATGWARAETASMVAVATAPAAFRAPVTSALSRGSVTWMLVRGLWRACDKAGLSAADAAHVAMVMLADDPATCVPERLEPDGSAAAGPWGHGAFWAALDREVTKLAACPDPEDSESVQAAAAAKAAREAAFRARSMWIRVNDDGTAQVGFTGSVLKVLALGDRLDKAARAARGAGDARTVTQLANDIGIALLGHAVIGAHALPDLDIFKTTQPTPEDLAAAGWTPQVIAALSALPPAVLQVVVPLLALHDPAQAHTLPGVARTVGTTADETDTDAHADPDAPANADPHAQADAGAGPGAQADAETDAFADDEAGPDVETPGAGSAFQEAVDVDSEPVTDPAGEAGHTGGPGCPACLPSARAARNHDLDETSRQARPDQQDRQARQDQQGQQDRQDQQARQDDSAHRPGTDLGPGPGDDPDLAAGEGPARDHDRDHAEQEQDPDPDPEKGSARAGEKCRGEDSASGRWPRMAWVGRVLGKHAGFVGPDLVRRLALSPGSTFVRLLVDPADGRCLERSTTSYSFDAAMRAQLAAADLTCRAPGCEHHAGGCQVDHVTEHGTPGGHTREANGQLVDIWHHDPKTAKAWDAVLHANRDVTWTTTLSRVYRTRVHDYRELVTVIVDALERIAAVEPQDRMDQINLEVYQALCYRAAGERLNEGDDDTYEETHVTRFGGDITIGLSHRDPSTGRRTPGPSPAAQARADAAAATARTAPTQTSDTSSDSDANAGGSGEVDPESNAADDQPTPRTPWSQRPDDEPPPF